MMTIKDQDLILDLALNKISKESFLKKYKVDLVDEKHVIDLVQTAYLEKNEDDLESALSLGSLFEIFNNSHIEIFCKLLEVHWHHEHEDIVRFLQYHKDPSSIEALFIATQTKYAYLYEVNECYSLIVKCTWALGDINTKESKEKLELLAQSDNEIIKKAAEKQLKRDIW